MDNRQTSERDEKLIAKVPPAAQESAEPVAAEEVEPPRSSPLNQLVFLAAIAGLLFYLYRSFGLEGLWNIGKAAFGLGFMVFIHELGHFLVAKWCDVHVETFSIGFGPPLPGCTFQYGETQYKLAMIPLGGYVKMIGEWDGEEFENDPRSFKNKTVGQRMAIISAGVIMNVLLAGICFIFAYMMGVKLPVAAVAGKEPGSPAWMDTDIRTGQIIRQIDGIHNATFEDLKFEVMLSAEGKKVLLVLQNPDGTEVKTEVEAVRGPYDNSPKIGITMLRQLTLISRLEGERAHLKPVIGPAAEAHVVTLKGSAFQGNTLSKADDTADGFAYDDRIVGMTDANQLGEYTPYKVTPLRYLEARKRYDYFDFAKRLQLLAGKDIVVQVERTVGGHDRKIDLLVPPAFYYTLPIRMKMGPVAAVRQGSPAARAGLEPGDVIQRVEVSIAGKDTKTFDLERGDDPIRLPFDLRQYASGKNSRISLVVERDGQSRTLGEVEWDSGWEFEQEYPFAPSSPEAISELGIAYRVGPAIASVDPAAAEAGLEAGDEIYAVRFRTRTKGDEGELEWSPWFEFGDDAEQNPKGWWPWVFIMGLQQGDDKQIQIRVKRTGALKEYTLEATLDKSWPCDERGFVLPTDWVIQKADTPLEAIQMGMRRTFNTIVNTYLSLRSMGTGRLPVAKNLRGPVAIANMAYEVAGVDLSAFLLFLGMINISLAVTNFLPIPVLDGGHMVFLIYEKIRGKPASENVRIALTYVGLGLLLALMVFVFYLDIARLLGFKK